MEVVVITAKLVSEYVVIYAGEETDEAEHYAEDFIHKNKPSSVIKDVWKNGYVKMSYVYNKEFNSWSVAMDRIDDLRRDIKDYQGKLKDMEKELRALKSPEGEEEDDEEF